MACDRLLEDGIASDREPADAREAAVLDVLKRLDQYPDEESDTDLVAATLARVDAEESKRRQDWAVSPDVAERARFLRLPDSFAVAAAILLAISIGVPLYNQLDSRQELASCQARQQAIGQAIAGFAGDNANALPIDLDLLGTASDGTYQVRNPVEHSWSSHLKTLVDDGRVPKEALFAAVAEDGSQTTLVAYRLPFQVSAHRFEGTYRPASALLGDRNPVVEAMRQSGRPCDAGVGANNHDRAQLVVINFRLETSILESPWLSRDGSETSDNLWVAHDYDEDQASATMIPDDHHDTVLAH